MRIGKITENVLKRSVWKQIHNGRYKNGAAGYTDCACFGTNEIDTDVRINNNKENPSVNLNDFKGNEILSSVHTVTADVKHCGKYAVACACNNIFAGGGQPKQVLLSITLPKDCEEQVLRQIMKDAEAAAIYNGAEIAGGHTEVSEAVNHPLVTATAVGYKDVISDNKSISVSDESKGQVADTIIKPDMRLKSAADCDIVVTKWIALSGCAMLSEDRKDKIIERYPSFIIDAGTSFGGMDYLSIKDDARIARENKAVCIHDVSSGGIFAALWELGQMTGCGMEVNLKAIPIRQESVEITDVFDVNPYLLASAGALLIATRDGSLMVDALEKEGIPSAIIGKLTSGNDRIIINEDETRFLDLPQSDEIHKIF